jgi:dTDP-4-amino-4,6-dideoxygalactose transaminase
MEFIDLKAQYARLKEVIDKDIARVLTETKFIGGPQVRLLEERLQAYTGRKHCVTCGNGTDALQLAFMALGVKEGDAVFCPDMTFIATVEPACMLGATPIFIDIDISSYNIDPAILEKRIIAILSEGKLCPKVVVAVDFLGNPAQMDTIQSI